MCVFAICVLSYRYSTGIGTRCRRSHLHSCLKFLPGTKSSVHRAPRRASRSFTVKKRVRNTPCVLTLSTQTFSNSLRTCLTILGWTRIRLEMTFLTRGACVGRFFVVVDPEAPPFGRPRFLFGGAAGSGVHWVSISSSGGFWGGESGCVAMLSGGVVLFTFGGMTE